MSLPPGFLDELRTRTSLSQVVGRKVTWDARKSNQGKGDMWSPCPFHQEKTASFHVDDRKGFYYCFGCHEKGDAISFVRQTENVSFMEAVEILAREAGMQMPARDPKAAEKADRLTQMAEVMEQAVQFYRLQLKTVAAGEARDYLARRGLSGDALDRWEIGFAPDAWQGLWDHLRGKSVSEQLILECGLAKPSNKGGKPYDTFRGRIMFPIRDARGRCIAFGGRAMDPNDNAKYLNSPETQLFDKGRSLFNHGPAREATGKGQPLIVAEGYMDVIALGEAGFKGAVAPLGTAVTEHQLQLMWRISPEPIIALDGDTAGLRAAYRVIDVALPMLEAGQSLRFAIMPEGQDPDDVIRAGGAPAMQKLLDGARPMIGLLWQRETEGRTLDSPERRAALDKDLKSVLSKIKDESIRAHYRDEFGRLRKSLFNPAQPSAQRPGRARRFGAPPPPRAETRASALVAAQDSFGEHLREAAILATFLTHPRMLEVFEIELERLEFRDADHRTIQHALMMLFDQAQGSAAALQQAVADRIGPAPLENLFSLRHVQNAPAVRNSTDADKAEMCLREELEKLETARGAAREVADAMHEITGLADEGLTWRLSQAAEARHRAGRGGGEDKADYDIAPSGAKMDRSERDAFDKLLNQIGVKPQNDGSP